MWTLAGDEGTGRRAARMVLSLLALQAAPAAADSREPLVWLLPAYAPFEIREGPFAGRGFVERMLTEVLQPSLPQYRHEMRETPPARIGPGLTGATGAACFPSISRTPARAAQYSFTSPLYRFMPVGVVMRRGQPLAPASETERPAVALKDVLSAGLRLGLVGFRVHGPPVDAMLQAAPQQVFRYKLASSNQSVLAMLAREHGVDAALVFEFELTYFARVNPELGRQLGWWPLAELSETQLSYIACSPNRAGQQAAAAINRVLARPGERERVQALYEQWLEPGSQQQIKALRNRLGERFWRE